MEERVLQIHEEYMENHNVPVPKDGLEREAFNNGFDVGMGIAKLIFEDILKQRKTA
ncbi:hypothetical protein [Eubacterium sp.]|uniref:hypothetical protein n=1 Tax=Eubacterium sp. TaxID=142586 RepID=UPI002FC83083